MNQEKIEQEIQRIESEIEKEQSFKPLSFAELMAREFKDTESTDVDESNEFVLTTAANFS